MLLLEFVSEWNKLDHRHRLKWAAKACCRSSFGHQLTAQQRVKVESVLWLGGWEQQQIMQKLLSGSRDPRWSFKIVIEAFDAFEWAECTTVRVSLGCYIADWINLQIASINQLPNVFLMDLREECRDMDLLSSCARVISGNLRFPPSSALVTRYHRGIELPSSLEAIKCRFSDQHTCSTQPVPVTWHILLFYRVLKDLHSSSPFGLSPART